MINAPGARNARIDLLRGLSILLVLLLHFTLTYRLGASPLTVLVPPRALRALLINGNYAVTMFFVISGFLITSMSLDRYGSLGGIDVPAFYAFRFARILPCLLLGFCALALVAGPLYRAAHREDEIRFMYGYLACFDAIALGCATALLARRFDLSRLRTRGVQITAGVGVAAVYLRGIDGHEAFGFTLIAAGTAVLLLGPPGRPASSLPGRILRWFGRHSYELYLFHIVVLGFMRDAIGRERLAYGWKLPWLGIYLALSAALAAMVARVLSEPANGALRRWYARKARSDAEA